MTLLMSGLQPGENLIRYIVVEARIDILGAETDAWFLGQGMKMEGRGVDVRRPLPRFACRGGNCPHGSGHPEHNQHLEFDLWSEDIDCSYWISVA